MHDHEHHDPPFSGASVEDPELVELDRIETARLQQQATVGSMRSRIPHEQWLPLGAGKPYPPELPNSEDYVVEFEGADDPLHPQNWPMSKR